MSDVFGQKITVTLFGESHGEGVGAVIGGLPAGVVVDVDRIEREMARRAPGGGPLATPRKEEDRAEILSGVFEGKTTGAALAVFIRNTNTRSADYTPQWPRPSHADYTAFVKYGGCADYRGGGHFSARLTAPLVWAGALAKQILEARGIAIGAHIVQIGDVCDCRWDRPCAALFAETAAKPLAVTDDAVAAAMTEAVLAAKAEGDSVGGVIECAAVGVPTGLGNPFFDSIESRLSHWLFSIPAVKGVDFGEGFGFAALRGSEANDPFENKDGRIVTVTNKSGGINGGITNGMPIVCRVALRPTPSIAKEQQTVDLQTGETVTRRVSGRHDPCVVPRAVPVVEACMALCLLDELV